MQQLHDLSERRGLNAHGEAIYAPPFEIPEHAVLSGHVRSHAASLSTSGTDIRDELEARDVENARCPRLRSSRGHLLSPAPLVAPSEGGVISSSLHVAG
jgi:hypothetical protein